MPFLFAADRQSVIILAFWTLLGAGVFVSVGAWILLRREGRGQRTEQQEQEPEPQPEPQQSDGVEEPAGT
jgi:flagellar biosynthesis/type III secretory pathway M-ring protein FliF/YscJ